MPYRWKNYELTIDCYHAPRSPWRCRWGQRHRLHASTDRCPPRWWNSGRTPFQSHDWSRSGRFGLASSAGSRCAGQFVAGFFFSQGLHDTAGQTHTHLVRENENAIVFFLEDLAKRYPITVLHVGVRSFPCNRAPPHGVGTPDAGARWRSSQRKSRSARDRGIRCVEGRIGSGCSRWRVRLFPVAIWRIPVPVRTCLASRTGIWTQLSPARRRRAWPLGNLAREIPDRGILSRKKRPRAPPDPGFHRRKAFGASRRCIPDARREAIGSVMHQTNTR